MRGAMSGSMRRDPCFVAGPVAAWSVESRSGRLHSRDGRRMAWRTVTSRRGPRPLRMQNESDGGSTPLPVVAAVSVLATSMGFLLVEYPLPVAFTLPVRAGIASLTVAASLVILATSKTGPKKVTRSEAPLASPPPVAPKAEVPKAEVSRAPPVPQGATETSAVAEPASQPVSESKQAAGPTRTQLPATSGAKPATVNAGVPDTKKVPASSAMGDGANSKGAGDSKQTAPPSLRSAMEAAKGILNDIKPLDAGSKDGSATATEAKGAQVVQKTQPLVRIKVLGVGGGGGNAVNRMMSAELDGIDFWILNTDLQALGKTKAKRLALGMGLTRGLGAGGTPSMGRSAAEDSKDEIKKAVSGSDMVFITAGMGGGTGSGAAPVVANIAKSMGILTVGVVTKPFSFEGKRRETQAEQAIEELKEAVDTLIIVSNDRLLSYVPESMDLQSAFSVADDVLRQGIIGISQILLKPGLVNVDFADVKTTMLCAGTALMGIGRASGEDRAVSAAQSAITSPLLDYSIGRAEGVVFNITGGPDMTLQEVNEAAEVIYDVVGDDANIIFGALVDENAGDEISLTVVATGVETQEGTES